MSLCHGCHNILGSDPVAHTKLWETKFTKKERNYILKLKNDISLKKRDILTEERYNKLNEMLKEVSNP